jgi:hypothetical protein
MKKLFVIIYICFGLSGVFGQTANKTSKAKKVGQTAINPKNQLKNAVAKSKNSKKVRIEIESKIQNKEIASKFERVAPDRFSFVDKVAGKITKEAIEISKQRYQKKGEQWIKTRKDYAPLRDQYDMFFPNLTSKPDDIIKITKLEVTLSDKETVDGKNYQKYAYSIFYDEMDNVDSGVAWINDESGLLERLETQTVGLFGAANAVWIYNYDDLIIIDAPKDFIEKDWIN